MSLRSYAHILIHKGQITVTAKLKFWVALLWNVNNFSLTNAKYHTIFISGAPSAANGTDRNPSRNWNPYVQEGNGRGQTFRKRRKCTHIRLSKYSRSYPNIESTLTAFYILNDCVMEGNLSSKGRFSTAPVSSPRFVTLLRHRLQRCFCCRVFITAAKPVTEIWLILW